MISQTRVFLEICGVSMSVPEGYQRRHENYADPYADPLSLLKVGDSDRKGP